MGKRLETETNNGLAKAISKEVEKCYSVVVLEVEIKVEEVGWRPGVVPVVVAS